MNLKKYLDAANLAEARVTSIAAQIDETFESGDTEKALGMKAELDTAKAKAREAHELYISMRDATSGGDDPARRVAYDVEVVRDEGDQPFADDREYFKAVKNAALYPKSEDQRLRPMRVKDATGLSEGVPEDGGYLLPQQTSSRITEHMLQTGEILSRISIDQIESNNMSYNGVDETTHVGSVFGGVVPYWLAEGGTITASKPRFWQLELKLKKVGALCYATDEQLEDTRALESWLMRNVPNALRWAIEDTIVEGSGVGKPMGIKNSPSLVTVLRTDHTNLQLSDINRIWSRRWRGLSDYVWLINPEVTEALDGMTASTAPVYLPPGGLSAAPYGTLKGRPVIETEFCQALYDTGDIMLCSLSQYQAITKAAGVQTASSIHVAFLTDETAFRFVQRIHGGSLWNSAVTPLHGTNALSPFVTCSSASS